MIEKQNINLERVVYFPNVGTILLVSRLTRLDLTKEKICFYVCM